MCQVGTRVPAPLKTLGRIGIVVVLGALGAAPAGAQSGAPAPPGIRVPPPRLQAPQFPQQEAGLPQPPAKENNPLPNPAGANNQLPNPVNTGPIVPPNPPQFNLPQYDVDGNEITKAADWGVTLFVFLGIGILVMVAGTHLYLHSKPADPYSLARSDPWLRARMAQLRAGEVTEPGSELRPSPEGEPTPDGLRDQAN